jgi:hypothetical protein
LVMALPKQGVTSYLDLQGGVRHHIKSGWLA